MKITLNSIQNKLGFDPLNPPERKIDDWEIDDATPSIWSPLTEEEKLFLFEKMTGIRIVFE